MKSGGGVSNSQDFSDEKDDENQEIVANKTDINFNIITRCYSSSNVYSESSFGGTGIADYVGDITLYWYQEGGKLCTMGQKDKKYSKNGQTQTDTLDTVKNKSYMHYSEAFGVLTYRRYGRVVVNSSTSSDVYYSGNYYRFHEIRSTKANVTYTNNSSHYFYTNSSGTTYFLTSMTPSNCTGIVLDTIYANYYKRYTASFNSDGGSSVSSKYFYATKSYTLPAKPTKTGYRFLGWYNFALSSSNYDEYETITNCASNHSWIAKWEKINYTLTYNANGGSVSPTSKSITYNSQYGSLPTPTRTGYNFDGWYTSISGGTRITSTSTYSTAGNSTIYAHWTIQSFTVTLSIGDSGIASVSGGGTYNYGSTVTISANVKSGYSFSHWSDGSAYASMRFTITSNLTLKAYSQANQYTVTFNPNGGSVSTGSKTVTFNSTYGTLPTPTRANYTFLGWYTSSIGGTQKTASTTYTTVGNSTLYAQWEPIPVTHKVCLRVISKDGAVVSASDLGGSVRVYRYVISGQSSTGTYTTQTVSEASYASHQGHTFELVATAKAGYVFAGFSTSSTPSASIKQPTSPPANTYTAYPTSGTTYYVYFKQMSGNTLKYDETDKYFYFEYGYYPQSEATNATTLNSSATTNGESFVYNNGTSNVTIPVYTYGGERYVKVSARGETKWFKFEPIRWRISDYGVEKTERNLERYTSLYNLRNYTSYSTNFTAVSDLILGVGAMHDSRQTSEGMSVTEMKGFQNVEELTVNLSLNEYSKNGIIKVDSYATSSQGNAVSTSNYSYLAPIRIASLEEIEEVGLVNKQARASDMVSFILGMNKDEISYWTRDLSNLGSGVAITASGTQVRPWLDQMMGMRFAYTFSEGSNASFY